MEEFHKARITRKPRYTERRGGAVLGGGPEREETERY